jgi:phosphoribosylformylglycinamidine (FGAM) synthase PurS component
MLTLPKLNLFDIVALKNDLLQHRLQSGQVGTIIEILAPEVYEIEFSDDDGQTYAMQALPAYQPLKLHYKPMPNNNQENNPNLISENFAVTVTLEDNGYYLCHLSNPSPDPSQNTINSYGQTQEHAIAISLEQLAEKYRLIAEEQQNVDMLTVERSADGEVINKLYHVTLHFECTIDAESKFEAMHNTIMGNTVVENSKITVIEVAEDLPFADILELGA